MDTTRSAIYDPSIHEHPLSPSARFIFAQCDGCHVMNFIYGGYSCHESYCYGLFHKECAEAPLETNHPSHPEHPLLLTSDSPSTDGPCGCCGQKLLSPCYSCPTCEFKVNLICGLKPSPPAIEYPMCHDHPLVFFKKREEEDEVLCDVCKESIGGPSYSCLECHLYFHLDYVHLSQEINHPCHSSHPLKIIASESLTDDDAEKSCNFCSDQQPEKVLYHCSICNFTMCLSCTKLPPPLVVEHTKTHTHPLRLFSSKIVFTCKVCGVNDSYPQPNYICIKCDFVVDGYCIGLPRVININRHDHRISFTHHLGRGRISCGVCRGNVSQYYGAYSCSVCPSYAVHPRCAIDVTVWDGMELEGKPENYEDIAPFKVVGDNLIRHFSHEEHTLRLHKDEVIHDDEYTRCEACIGPVGFGPTYNCEKCPFILHEKCANLPRKKKLVFDTTPYTLKYFSASFYCNLCGLLFAGFKYTSQGITMAHRYVDVYCGSLSEPFVHDGHLHPLYFRKTKDQNCYACNRDPSDYMLCCDDCGFDLCLYCVTLPKNIWRHRSHEQPLTLSYGGKARDITWCEVCETELDLNKWFFTCTDSGVTLHVHCVLGDFSRLKPGLWFLFVGGKQCKVVLNNRNTRPFCSQCHSRCKVSVILKDKNEDNGYICSNSCLSSFSGVKFLTPRIILKKY